MCGHVENAEVVEVEARWWRLCTRRRTAPLLLEVCVLSCHPLLHGLQLLVQLLFFSLMLLLQLHVTPVGLLKLPLYWFVQSMHPIAEVLHIYTSKPNSRDRGWRARPAICGPHTINSPLVVAANRLGSYIIITYRWASRSARVPLLRLLQLSLGQSLGELMP